MTAKFLPKDIVYHMDGTDRLYGEVVEFSEHANRYRVMFTDPDIHDIQYGYFLEFNLHRCTDKTMINSVRMNLHPEEFGLIAHRTPVAWKVVKTTVHFMKPKPSDDSIITPLYD